MNVKLILRKLAEIKNKADKDHVHENLLLEIKVLKERVTQLEDDNLYFEETKRFKK